MPPRERKVKAYADLVREIAARKLGRFFLFYGEEEFLKKEALREFEAALFKPEEKALNLQKLSGQQTNAEEVINAVSTAPMFGTHRLVEVHDAQRLSPPAKERLIALLPKIPETGVTIFLADKTDFRQLFWKFFLDQGAAYEFASLLEKQALEWLFQRAKRSGIEVEEEAAWALVEKLGTDAGQIASELEKLATLAQKSQKITKSLVEQAVGFSQRFSVYQLLDAVGERNLPQALVIYNDLVSYRESLTQIVYWLGEHFYRLYVVTQSDNGKLADPRVAALHPFVLNKCRRQAKNFSVGQLSSGLSQIAQADADIRLSKVKSELVVETLLVRLCRLSGDKRE